MRSHLGNSAIFQSTPHIPGIFSSSLQVNILPYSSPPELSENIYFHGVSFKFLRATPSQSITWFTPGWYLNTSVQERASSPGISPGVHWAGGAKSRAPMWNEMHTGVRWRCVCKIWSRAGCFERECSNLMRFVVVAGKRDFSTTIVVRYTSTVTRSLQFAGWIRTFTRMVNDALSKRPSDLGRNKKCGRLCWAGVSVEE